MDKITARLKTWQKTAIAVIYDTVCVIIAIPLAIWLRYSSFPEALTFINLVKIVLISTAVQSASFHYFGMYRGIWRFSSTPDLVRLIKGVSLGTALSFVALFLFNRLETIPRSVFIIDWLLLIVCLGGGRLGYRVIRDFYQDTFSDESLDRVLIIGAGSSGESLLRDMRKSRTTFKAKVIGFIDDDPGKRKRVLHGVKILGDVDSIPKVVKDTQANKIFIAIPSATNSDMSKIIASCKKSQVEFKTLPPLIDLLDGKVSVSQLREIEPEDFLGRQPINLDTTSVSKILKDKTVLVSGAGGSIGFELCHQIARFQPRKLILFEMSEFFLYEIEHSLKEKFPDLNIVPILGDIRCREKVAKVFGEHKPELVYHAAAYKHVPAMEQNPYESIKTNVLGTKTIAEVAKDFNVRKFVMISTDKAVNPVNIMGATKRLAEKICEIFNNSNTEFMTVRFGNVLGSSGSVIPLFKKQIARGGPVTVTDPGMSRYFMSISEASQLVLQAGALGLGGETFVLDMGEPIKIIDLARQMIELSGANIEIEVTGLREGEKLNEELICDDEEVFSTAHPKVKRVRCNSHNHSLHRLLQPIEQLSEHSSLEDIVSALKKVVPEFKHSAIKDEEIGRTLSIAYLNEKPY